MIKETNFSDTCEDLPKVIKTALSGTWPETLRGPEIVDIIILIEYGVTERTFREYREEEKEAEIWSEFLDDKYTARLQTFRVADIHDEDGCAELAHAEYYSTLKTKAPPIILFKNIIRDGHHRFEAARIRGDEFIEAYVITSTG